MTAADPGLIQADPLAASKPLGVTMCPPPVAAPHRATSWPCGAAERGSRTNGRMPTTAGASTPSVPPFNLSGRGTPRSQPHRRMADTERCEMWSLKRTWTGTSRALMETPRVTLGSAHPRDRLAVAATRGGGVPGRRTPKSPWRSVRGGDGAQLLGLIGGDGCKGRGKPLGMPVGASVELATHVQGSQLREGVLSMPLGVWAAGGGCAQAWKVMARWGWMGSLACRPGRWCRGGGCSRAALCALCCDLLGCVQRGGRRRLLGSGRLGVCGRRGAFEGSVSVAVRARVPCAAGACHAHPAIPIAVCLRPLSPTTARMGVTVQSQEVPPRMSWRADSVWDWRCSGSAGHCPLGGAPWVAPPPSAFSIPGLVERVPGRRRGLRRWVPLSPASQLLTGPG